MKLRALERPRVPIPVLGDKLTVWYESGGQVAAWRGGVVRLRRDGAEMLVSFDAMPPHHADKEKWIEIAEDEWALGSHWCRNPSGAQIVEACAKDETLTTHDYTTVHSSLTLRALPRDVHSHLTLSLSRRARDALVAGRLYARPDVLVSM